MKKFLCTWFGEVCYSCSLTVLPGPAWVVLKYVLQRNFFTSVQPYQPSTLDVQVYEAFIQRIELLYCIPGFLENHPTTMGATGRTPSAPRRPRRDTTAAAVTTSSPDSDSASGSTGWRAGAASAAGAAAGEAPSGRRRRASRPTWTRSSTATKRTRRFVSHKI